MKALLEMDTIQLDVTSRCVNSCSNCTHLCGHFKKQWDMSFKEFKQAVDSMKGYPSMVGLIGGDPILNPEFERFCKYLQKHVPKERAGLWTCLPEGFEKHRELIVETFGNIFINDHTRDDILHHPVLVASDEVALPGWQKDYLINRCWVQNTWSASINPKGAWFCEVAAALAMLLDVKNLGWDVTTGWWGRSPQHFISQMAMCHYCGCAMPLKRRCSTDGPDDISPELYKAIKDISPKLMKEKYVIHDCKPYEGQEGQLATYKDISYRDEIAGRYGMFLSVNDKGFQTPYLMRKWKKEGTDDQAKD